MLRFSVNIEPCPGCLVYGDMQWNVAAASEVDQDVMNESKGASMRQSAPQAGHGMSGVLCKAPCCEWSAA